MAATLARLLLLLTIAGAAAVLAVAALMVSTGEAAAAVCPPRYYPSGLMCCRVIRGRPRCQYNARIATVGHRFFAPGTWRWRGAVITVDRRDLTEAALATPQYRPRPIAVDARVLRPEDDRCDAPECRFDAIRALGQARRGRDDCLETLYGHYCRHSMWRDLDIEQRLARLLVLGREYAERYRIDVRAMPCIAAIETRYLEPLTVSQFTCTPGVEASDQGLPQIIRPTFRSLHRDLDFQSTVAADPADAELDAAFSDVARSVRHQLELMAAVLAYSGLNEARTNYQVAFTNYNGSSRSLEYGARVQSCFACMRERVDMAAGELRGDPLRCLEAASGGGNLRQDFRRFRGLCDASPDGSPEGPEPGGR